MELFNHGNIWKTDPGTVEFKAEFFFRGIGGMTDCATLLRHVSKTYYHPQQVVMFQGIEFERGRELHCTGETTAGFLWTVTKDEVQYSAIKLLVSLSDINGISEEEFDQYSKIQMRHQIGDGEWSEWISVFG